MIDFCLLENQIKIEILNFWRSKTGFEPDLNKIKLKIKHQDNGWLFSMREGIATIVIDYQVGDEKTLTYCDKMNRDIIRKRKEDEIKHAFGKKELYEDEL